MDFGRTYRIVLVLSVLVAQCLTSAAARTKSARLGMPLPGLPCPTSSFGSHRTGHIHAGLDFSTGGRTGVPVLAVDTCWVWRISVKNSGYGRALYAVLAGGEVAVYGHLSRFAAPMERVVETEQNLRGQYEVEIYNQPTAFRFLPGDTVAFSGDTGAGPPHLHFELRSAQDEHDKISPLPERLDLRESSAPTIKRIRIYPLGADCALNGQYEPVAVSASEPAEEITLTGPFGISVQASDVVLCERVMSPTWYEILIDDQQVWKLDFSRFPFAKSHFVQVFYDVVRGVPYVRLFDPYGTDLEGFDCYRASGTRFFRALAPGRHVLKVLAGDPWDNSDQISVPFTYGLVPDFEVCSLESSASGVAFRLSAAEEDCSLGVAFRAPGGVWRPAEAAKDGRTWTGVLRPDRRDSGAAAGESPGLEVLFKLSGASALARECILGTVGGGEATRIQTEIRPDFVVILVHTPSPPRSLPRAEVTQGQSNQGVLLQPIARNTFRGCYYPGDAAGDIEIRARLEFAGIGVEKAVTLPVKALRRGRDVRLDCPRFQVVLSEGRARNMETLLTAAGGEGAVFEGFSGSAGRLVFEPADVFFESGVEVSASSDQVRLGPKHGLYSLASGRPTLLAPFDSQGRCRARIWTLDPLAVLEDTAPPLVKLTGTPARKRDGTLAFSGNAHDSGSGIDSGSIRASIDGEAAIASYDPDTGGIKVRSTKPLPFGRHRLRLEAQDRIGNLGSIEIERDLLR